MKSTLALPGQNYKELMSSRSETIGLLEQMTQQFVKRAPSLYDRIAAQEVGHELGELRKRWRAAKLISGTSK